MHDFSYGPACIYWGSIYTPARERGACYIHTEGYVLVHDINSRILDIQPNGVVYYKNSIQLLHRTDGPAVINANGRKEYWINGIEISPMEFFTTYGAL